MPYLFLLFIIMPIVEIAVLIKVGGAIGAWTTIGIVILTAVVGTYMLRQQGMAFSEIQERGRWASAQTLRTYLDAVAASTTMLQGTHSPHGFATWLDDCFIDWFPWWR